MPPRDWFRRLRLRGLNLGRDAAGGVWVNALLIFGVDPFDAFVQADALAHGLPGTGHPAHVQRVLAPQFDRVDAQLAGRGIGGGCINDARVLDVDGDRFGRRRLLILAGLLRLGFLANLISQPVLTGFKAGVGLVIFVGQFGKVLGMAAIVLVALLLLVWLFQRRMIYFPLEHDVPAADRVLPGVSEVSVKTADGLELGAWFAPGQYHMYQGRDGLAERWSLII